MLIFFTFPPPKEAKLNIFIGVVGLVLGFLFKGRAFGELSPPFPSSIFLKK